MTASGILYIIAAPSGAGKTSLVAKLLTSVAGVEVSVSHTTRPRRPGEQDGKNYYFVDPETFQALVQQGVFLEHARVFGYDYGTSRYVMMERLQAGVDVILEIDWQGARQVRALMPYSRTIFILPPSREALCERLKHRDQDDETVIERRMDAAVSEISHYDEFDYIIINDDFNTAFDALRSILIANRHLREFQISRNAELIRALLS